MGANDGQRPLASVIEGGDRALYGVTEAGGDFGFGTIFRLDKSGTAFTALWHFTGTNGSYPEARLLQTTDGLVVRDDLGWRQRHE